jgi:hypothetical protein
MIRNSTNRINQKFYISYNSKIDAISTYFRVSKQAAKYIYHLRRKGFPYKQADQLDFLQWTLSLQNALVLADTYPSFDWKSLQFGNELKALTLCGIKVVDNDYIVLRNKVTQLNDSKIICKNDINYYDCEWTVVGPKNKFLIEKRILRSCGLLYPQAKR